MFFILTVGCLLDSARSARQGKSVLVCQFCPGSSRSLTSGHEASAAVGPGRGHGTRLRGLCIRDTRRDTLCKKHLQLSATWCNGAAVDSANWCRLDLAEQFCFFQEEDLLAAVEAEDCFSQDWWFHISWDWWLLWRESCTECIKGLTVYIKDLPWAYDTWSYTGQPQ